VRSEEIKGKVLIEDLVRHYGGTVNAKGEARCLFPVRHAHGDARPSMTVKNGIAKCWSQGCFGEKGVDIFGLVGVMEQLASFAEQKRRVCEIAGLNGHAWQIACTYDYVDEQGTILFQTVRYVPKDFRQRRPDGQGGWIPNLCDTRLVLYHLPAVLAATIIVILEGERDCETAEALGWPDADWASTTNALGVGKWRAEYTDSLSGTTVVIIPDVDLAGEAHLQTVAQALSTAHIPVTVCRLPHGKDLSEWRDQGGTQAEFWRLLARAGPWEPPAPTGTAEAAREQDHPDELLTLQEAAGLYTVRAERHGVTFRLERLDEQHGRPHAEVTVTLGTTFIRYPATLNLTSDSAQSRLATRLQSSRNTVPWKVLLQKACALVLERHRTGAPPVVLHKELPTPPLTYVVNPLVFANKVSVLFATGGMAKSTLALFIAMLIGLGRAAAGLRTLLGKALYLDYEDDSEVHVRRLRAIQAGHPELADATVIYQRADEPLWKLSPLLARRMQEHGITFLVVDSLLAATGGDASAEAATKVFIALRKLQVSALLIGHTPKAPADGSDQATLYGSVSIPTLRGPSGKCRRSRRSARTA
jgi:hypothetical protein